MKKLITLSIVTLLCHFASLGQCTIYGSFLLCGGSTSCLYTDSLSGCTGGTWSSSNVAIATVSSSGCVTGVSTGTVTISYSTLLGIVTTATVTVSPAPTPISGTTTFCAGTTTTLTDATSGGTWSSSNPGIASVDAATGAVTGVAGGTAYIYYTVAGGCSTDIVVTVESSFGIDSLSGDTILGPSFVCAGSSVTLTCGTTGGVWSSASTGVATVGASTGIVTGAATGVTTISYTVTGICGTASITRVESVNPTASAGTIYSSTSIPVSGTTTLYDYYSSGGVVAGMWSSNNPAVATIDGTGLVTGVSAGTATIQYVVNGCASSDTAFATITVTSLDGISGNIYFDSSYYGNVTVWLITFDTATLDLEAIDSSVVYCSGTSVYYSFTGIPSDSFRVKAATYDSSGLVTSGYIPTYHDSSYHWNTASVINHAAGTSDINENIHMHTGTTTSGPGFISGSVLTGADRSTSGGTPAVGLLIYVVNSTTGQQLQQTLTDASGNYSFTNLPVGATYLIYPEAINYATTVYSSITLTSGTPGMTAANFKQHTVSKTITPIPTGVNNITPSLSTVGVFPNPTSGKLNLQWNETVSEKGLVSVTDMAGRELFKTTIEMTIGAGNTQLDLSSIAGGLYLVSVKSGTISYNTTISINK